MLPQEKRILLPQDLKPVKTLAEYKAIGGLVGLQKARDLTPQQAIDVVKQSVRVNRLRDAYIRLVVTRGVGDLGLDPRKCKSPTVFAIADKIELYPKKL